MPGLPQSQRTPQWQRGVWTSGSEIEEVAERLGQAITAGMTGGIL